MCVCVAGIVDIIKKINLFVCILTMHAQRIHAACSKQSWKGDHIHTQL